MDSSYKQLAQLIMNSPHFDEEHRPDLKRVVYRLSLDRVDNVEHVNAKIKGQMEMEATMVFLVGHYRGIQYELDNDIEREEGLATLDVPTKTADGYKTTAKQAKAQVLANEEVAVLRMKLSPLKSLVMDLENIFTLVLKRNQKLEQLSINYRREQNIDDRSS